jgi:hypothetical protein
MDPTLQAAIVGGIVGGIGGALVGAIGAWVVARMNRAEARAAREDARQAREAERQDARLDRFADRKLSLAVDLLVAADHHVDQARVQVAAKLDEWNTEQAYGPLEEPMDIPEVGPTTPVRHAYLALDLVAPGVADAAGELYRRTLPLGDLAANWADPPEGDDAKRWVRNWAEANDAWNDARHAFVDAVRRDLGVDLDQASARPVKGT